MGLIHAIKSFALTIRESANDGSDFSNPDADYRVLFLGEDGQLHVKDSAGAVTDIGGAGVSVATDAIWDAAGDLVQGTGANTAAKLTLGAAGTVVRSTGATNAYAFPPGHEFDFVQFTSQVNVTNTTEGTADTVVASSAVAYDGSTIIEVAFGCGDVQADAGAAGRSLVVVLIDSVGPTVIGQLAVITAPSTTAARHPLYVARRLTPSAATHTYTVKAFVSAGTGIFRVGSGGTGANLPGYIRITKV